MNASKEFWPLERWPNALIPHPVGWRRVVCLLRGHRWAIHYWSGQGEPGWPQYEYCERCWKFRERDAR
jgi:hypothetical protein